MGLIYNTDKRAAIPRWRNHIIASSAGEVTPLGINIIQSPFDYTKNSLAEQIFSWNKYKTLYHAADLFSSAYTLGIEQEFKDIAEFLFQNRDKISAVLLRQIEKVLFDEPNSIDALEINFDFYSEEGKTKIIKEVGIIRNSLKKEPKNPLAWLELARNHSMLGNVEKSIVSINNALQVNETSDRFVLRSAARFFHHLGDNEKAHGIIKKSKNVQLDPWLLSSEIAFASILERRSTFLKKGKEFIKSQKFTPFQISELASAVGTVEFGQGDLKNAKSFFKTALLNPNDNSLAQVLWFHEYFPFMNISDEQLKIPLAFEAQSQSYYYHKKYKEACKSAIRWLNDEPYSTRPVRLASYISTIFLNDSATSIEILKHGLKVNPNDLRLLNSLCYNFLLENRIDEAEKCFKKYKSDNVKNESLETNIALVATTGLYYFRIGKIELGRKSYMESIDFAVKHKNDYLHALAIANYVREEMIICRNSNPSCDRLKINSLISKLNDLTKNSKHSDVIELKNKAMAEYDRIK